MQKLLLMGIGHIGGQHPGTEEVKQNFMKREVHFFFFYDVRRSFSLTL